MMMPGNSPRDCAPRSTRRRARRADLFAAGRSIDAIQRPASRLVRLMEHAMRMRVGIAAMIAAVAFSADAQPEPKFQKFTGAQIQAKFPGMELTDEAHWCDVFELFFSSRRRHTSFDCDWSSDVCSSD